MQYEHRGYHHAPQTIPPFNVLNMGITTTTSRPTDDLCQLDAVSSDLTVLGPNSDVEDEEFFGVETHCRRMPPRGGIRNSAVPSSFHRKHFSTDRIRPDLFSMDENYSQQVQALNWRFQQDLANCGGVLNRGRYPWEVPPPPPPPPQCIHPQRRMNKPNPNPPTQSLPDHPTPSSPEMKLPAKTRRRGRRGSRGKRHQSEIPNNEIPILEKSFENELAQQMANHVSNKSAMTPNFSSLRLHVAGGGTMIILNDQELLNENPELLQDHTSDLAITPTGVNEYTIKEKPTSSPSPQRSAESKKESLDFHLSQKISHPKGCGAFFPPQVLKQLQEEASGKTTPPLSSNFDAISLFSPRSGTEEEGGGGLRSSMSPAKTSLDPCFINPDQAVEFFQELKKESTGTGCFLPAYLQEQDPDFEEAPDGVLQEQHALTKNGENSIFVDENAKGFVLSKELSAEGEECELEASNTAGDLIEIIETHDFTTFTSPLHLEEALGDLSSHQTVQEETEQRLINLQIENEELKNSLNEKSKLQAQMESLLTMNQILQSLLYIERNKSNKKTWYQDFTPIGLSLDRSFNSPAASSVKPMTDQGIQVEDKKIPTGKTTVSGGSNPTKGHTRLVSTLAGDSRTAGKDSMKNTPGNITAKRTSGLNLVEKSNNKDSSKLQGAGIEKERQDDDDAQTKSQRQPTNQTTAVKSIDGVPLSNKKATQNRCGEAQNENSAKKKKPGSNLTSKTRPSVKKTSAITRTSRY